MVNNVRATGGVTAICDGTEVVTVGSIGSGVDIVVNKRTLYEGRLEFEETGVVCLPFLTSVVCTFDRAIIGGVKYKILEIFKFQFQKKKKNI